MRTALISWPKVRRHDNKLGFWTHHTLPLKNATAFRGRGRSLNKNSRVWLRWRDFRGGLLDGFGDSQCLVLIQTLTNHLSLSRRPIDLDAIYFCRVTQTEVERQDTLGQIAGFTVVVPGVGSDR